MAVVRARVDDSELLRETECCGYKEPPQGHPTRRKHRGRNCLDASVGREGLRERLGRTVSGDCAEAHDDGRLEAALAHDLGVKRELDLLFFKLASARYAKPFEDPGQAKQVRSMICRGADRAHRKVASSPMRVPAATIRNPYPTPHTIPTMIAMSSWPKSYDNGNEWLAVVTRVEVYTPEEWRGRP